MQGKIILVIDDDPEMLRLLEHIFSREGAQVCTAAGGQEGLRQFYNYPPHLVVLDVMMPEMDGWQVCARVRQMSDVPIIFLTALNAEAEIIHGLDTGAVDYVTKPFSPHVLVARARAALRQTELAPGTEKTDTYRDDYLAIDLDTRQVTVRGEPVKLTKTEYRLLAYLVENAGQVLTPQQILEYVWGREYRDSIDYTHVYMWRLRQKLEEDPQNPRYLLTEHGLGYRFQ
jgi:two-component system KDP operon response regulator KdpE